MHERRLQHHDCPQILQMQILADFVLPKHFAIIHTFGRLIQFHVWMQTIQDYQHTLLLLINIKKYWLYPRLWMKFRSTHTSDPILCGEAFSRLLKFQNEKTYINYVINYFEFVNVRIKQECWCFENFLRNDFFGEIFLVCRLWIFAILIQVNYQVT